MKDLKLDLDTHDLYIANYDLALADDIERVRQSLTIRLKTFNGEWFLDTTQGVDYYNTVFVKTPNLSAIEAMFKSTILSTPDVNKLNSYTQTFDRKTRQITIEFSVDTTFGTTTLTVEV